MLANPGNQTHLAGATVALALSVDGPSGPTLTYTATNLPPGLQLDATMGRITGQLASEAVAGSPYDVQLFAATKDTSSDTSFTWTVLAPARASGRVIVPSNMRREAEPNQTLEQPQDVPVPSTILGVARAQDASFTLPIDPGIDVVDMYRIHTTETARISLSIAAQNPQINDVDLLLLDSAGHLLDASETLLSQEILETPGAGEFLIGIRAFHGESAYTLRVTVPSHPVGLPTATPTPGAVFVPGEILVRVRHQSTGSRSVTSRLARRYDLQAQHTDSSQTARMRIAPHASSVPVGKISASGRAMVDAETAWRRRTLATLHALRADPDVLFAEPNYVRQPAAVPNDVFFHTQWHHELLRMPTAWDITTGDPAVIVAVIDTGVLLSHPDLQGRLIPGYDFISDAARANDGDGIDPDPHDAGDMPAGYTPSYHGTHVSGLLGARTNNTTGVAGVTWQTRIMPLRVAGLGGATDGDIAQAIRFAAGLPNNSGTVPPEPARIINLSLAGPGFSQTLNEAIQTAQDQGVIVVAAAGNDNTSTPYYPASYLGVISVTALDKASKKAWYANTGSTIDVAAPGGDLNADVDGDGAHDGILSTSGDMDGESSYRFAAGTSMAVPQVAGVAALMLAIQPELTAADIDLLLAGTHPETSQSITVDLGQTGRDDVFGHGMLHAVDAVEAALSISGHQTADSLLAVEPDVIHMASSDSLLTFEVRNAGGGTLHVTAITSEAPWLHVVSTTGTAPLTVQAIVDRTALPPGQYPTAVHVESDARGGESEVHIPVTLEVADPPFGDIGPVTIQVLDVITLDIVASVTTDATQAYAFSVPELPPGEYVIVSGTDHDTDGEPCERGDICGLYPKLVSLAAGAHLSDVLPVLSGSAQGLLPQAFNNAASDLKRHILSRLAHTSD